MSLIDIPPHGTPIFVKIKQDRSEYTSKSVNITNNTANWTEPAEIKCMIAAVATDKHPHPLRLSFRFEDASGKDFTRYGIAEIDCTTVFHEKVQNVEILLSNCTYNTKFRCTIDVNTSASGQPNSLDSFSTPKSNSISDFPSTTTNISERSVGALVTNARTGGTTVSFQAPKQPYELAPVPISEKRYQELETQVDDILSKIIIDSAQM
ncbi:hypothetical protein TVAG_118020 [Trichomonas vaginalis G3]|uniref:C2 NT-type domain-containing protein n=1 Tax=Trichomonas vaginalis (strain ATCC PRA-98 / G3) TaxID=412133 RepID=A2EHY9_TRIV3|nr:hypothetical protein TVAGG3_0230130 [Trichomonas vaginalis G3]EAY07721.1 hypothetical protein TVAG_118020 [Trichomonas vaginalis G3]KAI5552565.1 hypothetical protein TVAGG3_0230130 [Trichomonas vaginalis G3]|eukprot:XP_001319944.1 hypothetical protein [Trichomonas vaginalis G3]